MEIPTAEDVAKRHSTRLIEKIKTQHISDMATELYNELSGDMDQTTIILKVLSKLLSKNTVGGPSTIGIRGQALARLMERSAKFGDRDNRGGGRSGGGYRGNSPRSGGGGERTYGDRPQGGNYRNRNDGDRDRS